MNKRIKFSYVLPDPASYTNWGRFEDELVWVKENGYDAVELQITDPAEFDEQRVRQSLHASGCAMCAFQTGATYATRGNCLCTTDTTVRLRTIHLLKAFVDLAARWKAVIVFGSLQGRRQNEPDRIIGSARIREALEEVGRYATEKQVILAFEPVNHLEVGFHNTMAEVAAVIHGLNLPGLQMMIDTFHMNIEEKNPYVPLADVADLLAHVHLSETNRDILGAGHWNLRSFFAELNRINYAGYCSIGVYNTCRSRHECIVECMAVVRHSQCPTHPARDPNPDRSGS